MPSWLVQQTSGAAAPARPRTSTANLVARQRAILSGQSVSGAAPAWLRTAATEPVERPEKAPSLFDQIRHTVLGIPQGLAGLVGEAVETAPFVPRLLFDLAKDQDLKRDERFSGLQSYAAHYAPAFNTVGSSMVHTGQRLSDPARYGEAIREGRIFPELVEDVGNIAIFGGAAAKVLGRASMAVEVGAREAGAVAGTTELRSVGAAAQPLTVAEALKPVARATAGERGALARIGAELLPQETRVVPFPARGLARIAERAGNPALEQQLGRAGDIVHRISHYGERAAAGPAAVYTWPVKQLARGVRAVGGPDIGAVARTGISKVVQRLGENGGLLFAYTDQGKEYGRIRAVVERMHAAIQRGVISPARLAADLKLQTPEARAALFAVDQMMFPVVQMVREHRDYFDANPAALKELVDNMYIDPRTGKPVDAEYRPTPADVKVLVDYAEGRLDPKLAANIEQVTAVMGDQAIARRDALVEQGSLNPQQLDPALLPDKIRKFQRGQETIRNRVQRDWEREFPDKVRKQRISDAIDALAADLPDQPRVGDVAVIAQRRGSAAAVARERYNTAARDLAQAVDEYMILADGGPSPRLKQAENRVARLTGRINELRGEAERVQRQEGAVRGLSRASGEFEPGAPRILDPESGKVVEGEATLSQSRRPTPDLSKAEGVTAVRDEAKRVGREKADEVFAEADNATGTARPTLPPQPYLDQQPPDHWEVLYGPDSTHMTRVKRFANENEARKFLERLAKRGRNVGTARFVQLGGEWNWWYQLPVATRRQMAKEGWMLGRVSTGGRRKASKDGAPVEGPRRVEHVPLGPDQITGIINEQLNRTWDVDQAMGTYVDMFNRYVEAKSGRSVEVINQVAENLQLPEAGVRAAVLKIGDYAESLVDPVVVEMDMLRESYVNMDDEARAQFDTMMQAADDENLSSGDYGELLAVLFPELDVEGHSGVLATIGNLVDLRDLADWMRTGDKSPTMRAKLAKRSPANYVQIGRLAGERTQLGALVRELADEHKSAEAEVRAAQREAASKLSAARAKVENKGAVETGRQAALDETAGPMTRSEWQAAGDVVYGTEHKRARTGVASPAERLRRAQGAANHAAREQTAKVARLERSMRYRNEKIGDMASELSRGFVDRLVNDVNAPAIRSWRNIVRKAGEPLGRFKPGSDDAPPVLDGLLGRLSKAHGIYDELVEAIDASGTRRLRAVDGEPAPTHNAVHAALFEELMDEHGRTLNDVERVAYNDSVATEFLLDEINARELTDRQAGMTPNTPFRLREIIDNGLRGLPDDIRSQYDRAWERYQQRRSNLLYQNYDKYAEALPARYRTLSQTGRRQIRTLLDMAEERNRVVPHSGDVFVDMATATMDTLAKFVEAGIDPVHLIGGKDAPFPYTPGLGGSGRLQAPSIRAEHIRKTGLRPLEPGAQARVAADQLGKIMQRELLEQVKKAPSEGGFGRRADDILHDVIAAHLDETGERLSPGQMRLAAEEAGWRSTEKDRSVAEGTVLIPEAIARQSEDYSFTQMAAWKYLRAGNRKWKNWVLPLSPKWHLGNLFGNVLSTAVYRGVSPLALVKRMREVAKMEGGLAELWEREGLADWAPAELASHGLGWRDYRTMFDPEDKAPRTVVGRFIEKSYKANEFVDNWIRTATYLELSRKGIPTEAAMNATLRALGDFTRLSRLERRVIKEVIPFYPWLRHQTQATLRLPIESPARAAFLMHLSDLYTDPEEVGDLFALIGTAVPLGGGRFLDMGSLSPFAEGDVYRMPFSPTAIGRSVTPLIRFPIAALTGLDISTLQQVTRPAASVRRGPYGQEAATPFWHTMLRGRPLQGLGELGYLATQQLAPTHIRALRDLALGPNQRYSGTGYERGTGTGQYLPAERGGTLGQLLRGAGLPSVRPIDLAEARRRAEEQERRQRG